MWNKPWYNVADKLLSPNITEDSLQIRVNDNSIIIDSAKTNGNTNLFDDRKIEFGNNLNTITNGLNNWNRLNSVTDHVETELNFFRLNHFLRLLDGYDALFDYVKKETTKGLSTEEKIKNGIPLGLGASKTAKRKWVRYQIMNGLNISHEHEDRIYKALNRIKHIINAKLYSIRDLAQAGASPRFFQLLTNSEYELFLNKISNGSKHTLNRLNV